MSAIPVIYFSPTRGLLRVVGGVLHGPLGVMGELPADAVRLVALERPDPWCTCPYSESHLSSECAGWVEDPCDPCGHARSSHEYGVQGCSECDCEEWWKVK